MTTDWNAAITAKLEARIASLAGQRARAVANVRRNYEAGNITPATDRRQMKITFRILTGRMKLATRERDSWIERHPS